MVDDPSEQPSALAAAERELTAMQAIARALDGLAPDATARVLDWTLKHFLRRSTRATAEERGPGTPAGLETTFEDFPSLLSGARAESGLDRALLAAYFLQVVLSRPEFDSFSANRELRNAGHPSGNITRDLDALMARSPQLVMQVRKQGSAKQARKLYRLSAAGINAARALLEVQ